MTGAIVWTEERLAELRGYVKEGMTDAQIGGRMNKHPTAIQSARYDILKMRKTKLIWDKERLDTLRKLVESGKSDTEIAGVMETSRANIQTHRYETLGIVKRFPNRNAALDFLAQVTNHPVRSDTFSTNENIHINQLYHTLRRKELPIKCLRLAGRCRACADSSRKLGRADFSIYYVDGQQNEVYDMVKGKLVGSKLANVARILRMPRHSDIVALKSLGGNWNDMQKSKRTASGIRVEIAKLTLEKRRKKYDDSVADLEKKLANLKKEAA